MAVDEEVGGKEKDGSWGEWKLKNLKANRPKLMAPC